MDRTVSKFRNSYIYLVVVLWYDKNKKSQKRGEGMNQAVLKDLSVITDEEQAILDGGTSIDRTIYMQGAENTINSRRLLALGKLITLRTHTRFIHFPEHRHDYVEVVYMCQGKTVHIVNGKTIELRQGELLFMSQQATHEILECGEKDVAVNFIVLPEFFNTTLSDLGEENNPIRQFLVDCLCGAGNGPSYLHFQVADLLPIQNLVESLICFLMNETPNKRRTSQMLMTVLFLQLSGNTQTLVTETVEQEALFKVLQYVDANYVKGSFSELTQLLHYDASWLSRLIKKKTGKTYTQIVQEKRLSQAVFLLKNTDLNVDDIANAVGYENLSYFHRLFFERYNKTPKHYRDG